MSVTAGFNPLAVAVVAALACACADAATTGLEKESPLSNSPSLDLATSSSHQAGAVVVNRGNGKPDGSCSYGPWWTSEVTANLTPSGNGLLSCHFKGLPSFSPKYEDEGYACSMQIDDYLAVTYDSEFTANAAGVGKVKCHFTSTDRCFTDLPEPALSLESVEPQTGFTRYRLSISNWSEFPDQLFTPAPYLPPCGANPNASRTWVSVKDDLDNRLQGFCALGAAGELQDLWFTVPDGDVPPPAVFVRLWDRHCDLIYDSNLEPIPSPDTDPPDILWYGITGLDASNAPWVQMMPFGAIVDASVIQTATLTLYADGDDALGLNGDGLCDPDADYQLSVPGDVDRNEIDLTNGTNSIDFSELFTITNPGVGTLDYCFVTEAEDSAGNQALSYAPKSFEWLPPPP